LACLSLLMFPNSYIILVVFLMLQYKYLPESHNIKCQIFLLIYSVPSRQNLTNYRIYFT
jgi:hypothetical protein